MYHQVYLLVDGNGGILHPAQYHILPTSGTGNWEDGDLPAHSLDNLGETHRMTQITNQFISYVKYKQSIRNKEQLATTWYTETKRKSQLLTLLFVYLA